MIVQEITILRAACQQARKAHVFPDFRSTFRSLRMSGDSVQKAAWSALYDWDALDVVVNEEQVYLGFSIGGDEILRQLGKPMKEKS